MIPLSEVAKYIDNFERQGLSRAEAERTFWDLYRVAERIAYFPPHASFGAILESFLNRKTRGGRIDKNTAIRCGRIITKK